MKACFSAVSRSRTRKRKTLANRVASIWSTALSTLPPIMCSSPWGPHMRPSCTEFEAPVAMSSIASGPLQSRWINHSPLGPARQRTPKKWSSIIRDHRERAACLFPYKKDQSLILYWATEQSIPLWVVVAHIRQIINSTRQEAISASDTRSAQAVFRIYHEKCICSVWRPGIKIVSTYIYPRKRTILLLKIFVHSETNHESGQRSWPIWDVTERYKEKQDNIDERAEPWQG